MAFYNPHSPRERPVPHKQVSSPMQNVEHQYALPNSQHGHSPHGPGGARNGFGSANAPMPLMSRGFRETDTPHSRHHRGTSDFDTRRSECLRRGVLYEDPDFLPQDTSVYYSRNPPYRIEWKRPGEIAGYHHMKPNFFLDNASRFDVKQGELGDCWVVSSIACLSSPDHRELFRRVVPADQGFHEGWYAGIFRFNFWYFGKWVEVIVDDKLPTSRGQLLFVHSNNKNEFWSALLEKAYAKLNGSYEALKAGNVGDALTDFTGGICESYILRGGKTNVPPNIVNILFKALDRQSLIGCGINPIKGGPGTESILPTGLCAGHAYSITDLREILLMSEDGEMPITLVRVRNPWGSRVEWNGAWGDTSREWNSIPEQDREKMGLVFRDDGEFWMEFGDFKHNFDSLDICNLTPDSPIEMPKQWHTAEYQGSWQHGFNAGGRPSQQDTHWTNPQYRVTLSDMDEDGDNVCSFIIQMMQKDRRKMKQKGKKNLYIGFVIYQLHKEEEMPIPKEFFETNRQVESSGHFIDSRQIITRMTMSPGEYVVVPCTYDPNELGSFFLRFFFENKNAVANIDATSERVPVTLPPTPPDNEKEEKFKRFFYSVSGENMEIDPFELRSIVNDALRKEPLHRDLSVDACKSFVLLLDTDNSGQLGYPEFQYLWNLLRSWKKLFYQFDADQSGKLSSFELRRAVGAAGYKLNNSTMKSLVYRYADERSLISLDNYMICLAKLMKLFNDFKKNSSNNQMSLSINQWLERSLSV
ncbi:calpain-A-like isoform X3 [Mizuhopecten yessoensis]|uniref:Calpain-9 n=1 Tax=Mizuhopecten yessoensis TaxID=6573 RepID=A0A210R710_MIZYE|nr:calpain-A-like isoform X2 [Mizuhopecten yessoensis]XP_021350950.1 calpain-A-like isoform X3 [Mizuhopecten yessoensis]OWF56833.1 Calpain-9 [Mizuhopecten yessoensis]